MEVLIGNNVIPLGDVPTIVNQSRLQVYMDCPRKYWWQFEENLTSGRPAMALEIGQGVHTALALLGSGEGLEKAVVEGRKRFMQDMPKRRLPGDDEQIEEGLVMVESLVREYVSHWGEQNLWKPLAQEVSGTVEVGSNTNVHLRFRTDKLVEYHRGLWLVDHKTAARNDARDILKYQMDIQVTAYIYGCMAILRQRVHGVIIDVLVKTKVRQFVRDFFTRSDDEIRDFEVEFPEWIYKIDFCRKRQITFEQAGIDKHLAWPKNTKECFRFGTCQYRPLCLEPRNANIRTVFVNRTPDYVDTGNFDNSPTDRNGDLTASGAGNV